MLNKLYGIDYETYICGGIGSQKLIKDNDKTELFYNESKMLLRLSELKESHCVDNIELFTTSIIRQEYRI